MERKRFSYHASTENPFLERYGASSATFNLELNEINELDSLPVDGLTLQQTVTIIASFVPDEVIYNVSDYSIKTFDGCFLFGDVSGFTDLCEKYNMTGLGGPSRLTDVLNNYIGAMVQEILSRNGDVLKFSGDAFLVLWKVTDNLSMRDAVREAFDCALVIQKSYGTYKTDVGIDIGVKLVVSAGNVHFGLIGTEETSHYLVSGKPVGDIQGTEGKVGAGKIIATPKACSYLSTNEYLLDELEEGSYLKVLGIGPNWRNLSRTYQSSGNIKVRNTVNGDLSKTGEFVPQLDRDNEFSSAAADCYSLRPAVDYAGRNNMMQEFRRFILPPVMHCVDLNEPLEYLTEMRQVVVVFLNIIVSFTTSPKAILELTNTAYKEVCRLAKSMKGCVNKVVSFDKDLMILVLFGLRGFKQQFESQIGLKFATLCYKQLHKIENIDSISIGLSSGNTYCGVFGHALRREYTAISLTVNKAARLMVAYRNKITCDRETFLRSKMDSRNFILQPFKELKGIINPGPIYEFRERSLYTTASKVISSNPLLGRDVELNLFSNTLKNWYTGQKKFVNTLIFYGESRQGKSRLLEEILYYSPTAIPAIRLILAPTQYKISFETTRLILLTPMGLSIEADRTKVEEQLSHRLDHLNSSELYCFLNVAFNVDFPQTPFYFTCSEEQKNTIRKKLILHLSKSIFLEKWLIIIDNAEYIDEESWTILKVVLQWNTIFFVAALGNTRSISIYADNVLKETNVKQVVLKDIKTWYRVGLACQMICVYGVPCEIEKILHTHCCGGNPGWVENFLLSLLQSDYLHIKVVTRKTALDNGLVLAPLYMLFRMTEEDIKLYKQLLEDSSSKSKSTYSTRWKLYVSSCKDNLDYVQDVLETKFKSEVLIPVGILRPSFSMDDINTELALNVLILKTFDSLTSFEQLLLKCSSILGEKFLRSSLIYIMSTSKPELTAKAVQKLFDIHVLSCARGDFINGNLNISVTERRKNPNHDLAVKCECKGFYIEDSCRNLPKYASCGYMRFRSPTFRRTTYNLLTENQKKEFHTRAIRFLEKETRKCRACGNAFFDKMIGEDSDDNIIKAEASLASRSSTSFKLHALDSEVSMPSVASRAHTIYSVDNIFQCMLHKQHNMSTKQAYSSNRFTFGYQFLNDIKKYNTPLIRTYANIDFTSCQCSLILSNMYAQVIEHCLGSENYEKLLWTMIASSYISFEINNLSYAMVILEKAADLLQGRLKNCFDMEWQRTMKLGKVYTIYCKCLIRLEQLDELPKFLSKALEYFGFKFPQTRIAKRLLFAKLKCRQTMWLYVSPEGYTGTVDASEMTFYNDLSECLAIHCEYFFKTKQYKEALLAAMWSLDRANACNSNFGVLCIAFKNMIKLANCLNKTKLCANLAIYGLTICHWKKSVTTAMDIYLIAKMYYQIFIFRICQANFDVAIDLGFVLRRICVFPYSNSLVVRLLPNIILILLIRSQLIDAVNLIHELEQNIPDHKNNSCKFWYFATCLMFQLETGSTITPYNVIKKVYEEELPVTDLDVKYRFNILMWLWSLRNKRWASAGLWQKVSMEFKDHLEDNIFSLITCLYFLESLLLYLVWKLDKRNFLKSESTIKIIKQVFKFLEKSAKHRPFISPRLLHLKAYYKIIKKNDYGIAMDLIQNATEIAEYYKNLLELSWINHSVANWKNTLSNSQKYQWNKYCLPYNKLSYQDVEIEGKLIHYSLNPPIYF